MRRWPLVLFAIVAACGRSQPAKQSQPAPADPPAAPAPAPPEPVDIAAALADPNRVLLGVVRTDNVLIPIAVYSKGRWGGPDDEKMAVGEEGQPVPATSHAWFLSNPPVPLQWFGSVASGGTIRLASAAPAPIDNHCQLNWALGVEAPPSTRKPHEHHTNLGIAATSEHELRAVDVLPNDGVESRRLSEWLRASMDAAERENRSSWAGLDGMASVRKPTNIARWLGRATMEGKSLWYAEIVRHYPEKTPSGIECGAGTVLRSWLVEDEHGQFTVLRSDHAMTDCDPKGDLFVTILGTLLIDGHRFVVTTEHGYEDEHYVIYEVTPAQLVPVLTVNGGGC